STGVPSRSGTRSGARAPARSRRRCTSSSAARAATPSSRCASAAAWARPGSSSAPRNRPVRHALLLLAAVAAGAVNAVGGGGTRLSFPAGIAWGLPSTIANATNAVAMSPGSLASAWAYRRELADERRLAVALVGPALLGGWLGAVILRHTSPRTFDVLVPW